MARRCPARCGSPARQGVDATHRLNEEAMQRTLSVLADYKRRWANSESSGPVSWRPQLSVMQRIARLSECSDCDRRGAGRALVGIGGGSFVCAGATADLPSISGDDILADIGGGSTEIALKRDGNVEAISLDIGCVRLTERIFHNDRPPCANCRRRRGRRNRTELKRSKLCRSWPHQCNPPFSGTGRHVSTSPCWISA